MSDPTESYAWVPPKDHLTDTETELRNAWIKRVHTDVLDKGPMDFWGEAVPILVGMAHHLALDLGDDEARLKSINRIADLEQQLYDLRYVEAAGSA